MRGGGRAAVSVVSTAYLACLVSAFECIAPKAQGNDYSGANGSATLAHIDGSMNNVRAQQRDRSEA